MVRITEELIRKRPEYSNCELGTLEELSLIHEYIERIEFVQEKCESLQTLLLPGNIIARIENVQKLKKLQFLNLAINNIEIVGNLEQCENLRKLDLSLNYIWNLESLCILSMNYRLQELHLSGNPCALFPGYRNYLMCILPQLESLDGCVITLTERLKAAEIYSIVEKGIREAQSKYEMHRSEQSARFAELKKKGASGDVFWLYAMENCPEARLEYAKRRQQAKSEKKQKEHANLDTQHPLFSENGEPLNVNQAKLIFQLVEDPDIISLYVELYKYLESESVQIDLNSQYVRINIQGYILQCVFPSEVDIDNTEATRSKVTGHMCLRMPKLTTNVSNTTIATTNVSNTTIATTNSFNTTTATTNSFNTTTATTNSLNTTIATTNAFNTIAATDLSNTMIATTNSSNTTTATTNSFNTTIATTNAFNTTATIHLSNTMIATTNSAYNSLASETLESCEWKQTREYLGLDSENLPHFLKAAQDGDLNYSDLPPLE